MNNWIRSLLLLAVLGVWTPLAQAQPQNPPNAASGAEILDQFNRQQGLCNNRSTVITNHERQVIMFSIGAVLLLLLLSTASVGVAVGVLGKPLFVPHMILAGLTVTVALVHVIVGLVWFFPF